MHKGLSPFLNTIPCILHTSIKLVDSMKNLYLHSNPSTLLNYSINNQKFRHSQKKVSFCSPNTTQNVKGREIYHPIILFRAPLLKKSQFAFFSSYYLDGSVHKVCVSFFINLKMKY